MKRKQAWWSTSGQSSFRNRDLLQIAWNGREVPNTQSGFSNLPVSPSSCLRLGYLHTTGCLEQGRRAFMLTFACGVCFVLGMAEPIKIKLPVPLFFPAWLPLETSVWKCGTHLISCPASFLFWNKSFWGISWPCRGSWTCWNKHV